MKKTYQVIWIFEGPYDYHAYPNTPKKFPIKKDELLLGLFTPSEQPGNSETVLMGSHAARLNLKENGILKVHECHHEKDTQEYIDEVLKVIEELAEENTIVYMHVKISEKTKKAIAHSKKVGYYQMVTKFSTDDHMVKNGFLKVVGKDDNISRNEIKAMKAGKKSVVQDQYVLKDDEEEEEISLISKKNKKDLSPAKSLLENLAGASTETKTESKGKTESKKEETRQKTAAVPKENTTVPNEESHEENSVHNASVVNGTVPQSNSTTHTSTVSQSDTDFESESDSGVQTNRISSAEYDYYKNQQNTYADGLGEVPNPQLNGESSETEDGAPEEPEYIRYPGEVTDEMKEFEARRIKEKEIIGEKLKKTQFSLFGEKDYADAYPEFKLQEDEIRKRLAIRKFIEIYNTVFRSYIISDCSLTEEIIYEICKFWNIAETVDAFDFSWKVYHPNEPVTLSVGDNHYGKMRQLILNELDVLKILCDQKVSYKMAMSMIREIIIGHFLAIFSSFVIYEGKQTDKPEQVQHRTTEILYQKMSVILAMGKNPSKEIFTMTLNRILRTDERRVQLSDASYKYFQDIVIGTSGFVNEFPEAVLLDDAD